jgi:tyrosine-protein kinase Etk/Wzc
LYSALPTKPKNALIISAGIMVGLILGLSAAFLRESWDERLNTPRQVTRLIGLPVLGSMGTFAHQTATRAFPP